MVLATAAGRQRSGDTLWLHIDQDVGRPITYGPVFIRRRLVGEPLTGGAPVLLLAEQEFTPPVDSYFTVP